MIFVVVQSLSCVRLFVTPWTAACQASLSITNSRSLLKLMSIESVMPSNHLILCCPLLLLPSIPVSGSFPVSQFFIRWPKYWSFSFNISPSNEYPGLICFRMDWLDLLAVQSIVYYIYWVGQNVCFFPLYFHLCCPSIFACCLLYPLSLQAYLSFLVFSSSVMSNFCDQYARPPSPSPTPRVYSNSCPLNR